jgi:amidohydrolase
MLNKKTSDYIFDRAHEIKAEVQSWREYLHQHPELSFQEEQTMRYVSSKLCEWGIAHSTEVAGTGITGILGLEKLQNGCIALRADVDALPIQEQNEVPYKSTVEGVMHACGHDVHTAVLLGTSKILKEIEKDLPCAVKLIFQPGEEVHPGGASLMIKAGVLENPKVEAIYGLHVFPELPAGKVGYKTGMYMASSDEIKLEIIGKGGHGAIPDACINPLYMGSEFILESKKRLEAWYPQDIPHVLTFGFFEAQGSTNVVPERAYIKGTFRTMNEENRYKAHRFFEAIAKEIGEKYGGQCLLNISVGYPFLSNHEAVSDSWANSMVEIIGADKIVSLPIRMTAEDFAFYGQEIPSAFFRLGVGFEDTSMNFGVHHPKFDIQSDALITGMLMLSTAPFSWKK